MKRIFLKIAIALALASSGLAYAQTSAPIKLRFAHSGAEGDTQHLGALELARRVKERSKGALEIQVFPNSTLGNDGTALTGVRAGTIDMSMTGNPYFTGLAPKLNALDLPYQFSSGPQVYKVLDGPVGRSLLAELDAFQFKGLAFWELGFRSLANNKRPVNTPEDIKGLKIRTTPNVAHLKAFQLLGASPQPMNYAEVFPALESGALDGHENPPITMFASKMYEVQKYLSLTRHAYTAAPVVINKTRFEKLQPELQKILQEEALAAATFQREYNAKREIEVLALMKSKGMQINETPDVAAIKAIVFAETRKMYIEKNGDAVLKAIDAVK